MDLTSCYAEFKASLEALSKENINDLSRLHDRVMVKLQLFIYTYKIDEDDYNKFKITLSSEVENLDANDSINKMTGTSSITITGLALMFLLIAMMERGINVMLIYLLFCGIIGFLLCLMDLSSTAQQHDKRKKVIYKMCLEILDKEKEKLEISM